MKTDIPQGLIFSNKRKKKSFIAVGILLFVQLSLIWPIFPFFASPEPQILGFPLPFAWVILMVLISFVTLLTYYKYDTKEDI